MTIELGPDEVSRIEAPAEQPGPEAAPEAEAAEAAVPAGEAPVAEEAASAAGGADAEPPAVDADAPGQQAGEADTDGEEHPGEKDSDNLIGSEWPPEPETTQSPGGEERVTHAFGREPGTPPPASSAPRVSREEVEAMIRSAEPPRRGGAVPLLVAGLVGGAVVLVGGGALQWAGLLPSPGGTAVAPADDGAIAVLKTELASLKNEVETVKAGAGNPDTSALSQSVTDISGRVDGLSSTLDQMKADIARLKDAIAQGAAGDGAAVQTLDRKIAALEASVAALGNDGSGVSQEAIDAINQKLGSVETAAAAATDAAKAGEGRLAALEQGLADLSGKVAGLSDQLARQAAQPKVALAIAAAALKSAVERGGPFTAEVETFAAIAPDSPDLPALREIAARGVASQSELVEGMDDAANAMIDAASVPDADAGFWDQLWSSAESLVKVRPIGAVEGDTVEAKVARMEVALKAGDLGKAIAEYETLPDAAKAAGQAFADRIRARIAARDLVSRAVADAMKSA